MPSAPLSPQRQVGLFFVVACALTAACQAPAIFALRAGRQPTGVALPLMVIGAAGPSLVALLLARVLEGREGLRLLLRRDIVVQRRLSLGFFAVSHVFVAHMLGSALLLALGQYSAQTWAYPPLLPEQIAIAVLAPLGEEVGWRAYALARLQRVTTPIVASVVIGVVWALWHLPTFFMPGAHLHTLLIFLPLMIAGSLLYTWLWNASGGSLLVVILAHLGVHLDNIARAELMGDGLRPALATTAVLVVVAAGLVATGRLGASTAVVR